VKGAIAILLLFVSNVFMTFAWYGHLTFKQYPRLAKLGIFAIILISWGLAFFEYIFQVPANKIGYQGNGGPFSLFQLKVLQEVITLLVFIIFTLLLFKHETIKWNYLVAFVFLILAVVFVFLNKEG